MNNSAVLVTSINCPSVPGQLFYAITSGTAIFINGLLFFIIRYNTTSTLQQYSVILRISCILDIYSALSQFLTQARPRVIAGLFTFSLEGIAPKLLAETFLFRGNRLPYILIPEFIGCYYSVCFCVIPFIYRYIILCWGRKMKIPELIAHMFILFLIVAIGSFTICHAASGLYEFNMQILPKSDPECTRFAPQYSPRNDGIDNEYFFYFKIFSYLSVVIIATYLITFVCAVRIHIFLHYQVNENHVQKKIQKQVSYTLAVQALCPFILYYLPVAILAVLEAMYMAPDSIVEHSFDLYAIIPVINAAATIILISPYRNAFLNFCSMIVYGVGRLVGKTIGTLGTTVMPSMGNSSSGARGSSVSPVH